MQYEDGVERPRSAKGSDAISDALTRGLLLFHDFFRRTHGAAASKLVSVVELTPEEREQINDGVGLLLKKGQQVVAVDDASGVAGGHGLGLMRVCSSMEAKPKYSTWQG